MDGKKSPLWLKLILNKLGREKKDANQWGRRASWSNEIIFLCDYLFIKRC